MMISPVFKACPAATNETVHKLFRHPTFNAGFHYYAKTNGPSKWYARVVDVEQAVRIAISVLRQNYMLTLLA
jgi:hypothetical protein